MTAGSIGRDQLRLAASLHPAASAGHVVFDRHPGGGMLWCERQPEWHSLSICEHTIREDACMRESAGSKECPRRDFLAATVAPQQPMAFMPLVTLLPGLLLGGAASVLVAMACVHTPASAGV
jgi:hypothetical protein